ncbi:S8 family serine peptidase [Actinokineospora soli]|uniref:S8 family serine peptidase n=1 Tax=Actinokineospora soli TaxID=1048753 RepID=A0ABW2TN62_9PSEU
MVHSGGCHGPEPPPPRRNPPRRGPPRRHRPRPAPRGAAPDDPPGRVSTGSDAVRAKLHPKLRGQLADGATGQVRVYATVTGDPATAARYLDGARVAHSGGAGIVLGRIGVQELPKLAAARGVVSVGPVEFAQTGRPTGDPDPGPRPSAADRAAARAALAAKEVPYAKAPPPAGSNFDELKDLAVLDAKTHDFAGAWAAGYTGAGTTVGVLDGGTDFGHPDLLGTWQTWSGLTGARAGWNGWPKAFDPYGVLQWLAGPELIDQGLSWYTKTTATPCPGWNRKAPGDPCAVRFATRTGPSRNFSLAPGTAAHTYRFPAGATKSGAVRMGSHPDDHLLSLYGERAAFLVTDATTAGVYDTVYVDLDNDYRFDDEKPVTKSSPASYRDMNGDGYTDLSGGLLYYISDGATPIPGGLDAFGVLDASFGPGHLLAWTGDYDPGIGGHGTLTASNIVGQGVINGRAPVFSDLPGGTYPGAVLGGAPHAKLAPFGDIYFAFEFSTQLGYFLSTRRGVDVTSNSYGDSEVDNDGWDAGSQEADVIHAGQRTTALFSTGNGAPGFGTVAPPSASSSIMVGASTQFGGTGWDSVDRTDQIVDNDVIAWSNRGFGATGAPGSTSSPTAPTPPATSPSTASSTAGTPGRRGAGPAGPPRSPRRGRAGLPGVAADQRRAARQLPGRVQGHPQELRHRPRLRLAHPGRGLARRRRRGPRHHRRPRPGLAERVARGRLPRNRVPRVQPPDGARRDRQPDLHHHRTRHLAGLGPPARAHRLRDPHLPQQGHRRRERLQLRRPRLPDRPQEPRRRAPRRRPHGRAGHLPARPVRRQRRLRRGPGVAAAHLQLDRHRRRRQALGRRRRRRRRRPRQPADDQQPRPHL